MNSNLYNFVSDLLNQEKARVEITDKGFRIINVFTNYFLDIFSDRFNGFYFELFIRDKSKSIFDKKETPPTYRTENIEEVKLICDEIINKLDFYQNNIHTDASKYISFFRKILKNEAIDTKYQIDNNEHIIGIKESDKSLIVTMHQCEIKVRSRLLEEVKEPTICAKFSIHGLIKNPIDFYVPQYALKDYKLLNSEPILKNESVLNYSFENWLETISNIDHVKQSPVSKIIEYHNLNSNLDSPKQEHGKKLKI